MSMNIIVVENLSDMTLEDIAANQKEDHVEYNVVDEKW